MVLPAILNPFIEGAPAAVMTRIALDWIVDGTPLDELFDEVAEDQYTRELTLTHFVQVMLDVASGHRPSPRAAFLRRDLPLVASLSAFYRKLNRMELAVPEAVVRRTALRARQLLVASGGLMPEPIEGYAVRILDGNVLTGTAHRIEPLRTTGSAGLPGLSLAVYEPASGLILELILEEDAHCQERALVGRVDVQPGQLWIMDRNFCVRSLVFRIARRDAFFLVRWHRSTLPFRPAGRLRCQLDCACGFARTEHGHHVGDVAVPCAADWNGDGKKDLLVGYQTNGMIRVYLNSGTDAKPVFTSSYDLQAAGQSIQHPSPGCGAPAPWVCDFDADGRRDLLVGSGANGTCGFQPVVTVHLFCSPAGYK